MNISLFIGGLCNGGAERVTCNIANYLHNKGHIVQIITMSDRAATYYLDNDIAIIPLLHDINRHGFLMDSYVRVKNLCKILKHNRSDCYIVMLPITTILLLSLSKLFRIKVIASERSYPKFYNYFTKILLRLFAGNARAWVFQTEQAKEWYGKSIKGVRYNIIPNAINKECIDLRIRDFNDHANVIVSAGRLKPLKNHELILRAYARLKDKYPEYKIIIYGEGSLKEYLRNLSVELDIDKNVELPGFEPNLPAKVQNAKLFIMSSNFEGMPNALLEAMSLGVVCISTDCAGGAARSIIENGSNGLIVPCNDVESLAEAIDLVLSDDEYCRKLVTNGIRIRDTHNSESIYKKWELLVEDIVNS